MSAQASRRSSGVTTGRRGSARLLGCSTCTRRKSRPSSGSASSLAAASLICSYSSSRRTSSARGSSASLPSSALARRQQHARLDLDQHRRHQQVLGGELEVARADLVDVLQVLLGHIRQRDVEDVEVLPPDQVQQQIERAFEGLEEHLERVGRDVQVLRQREQRLAVQARHRHAVDRQRCASPRAAASLPARWCRSRARRLLAGVVADFGLVDVALLRARGRRRSRPVRRGRCRGPTAGRGRRAARPRAWASWPSSPR